MIRVARYDEVYGKKFCFTEDGIDKGWAYIVIWVREGNKTVVSIQDVFVLEEYRKKGIAKRLIESIIKYCKTDLSIYKVILECSDENVGLYDKLGFNLHENHMRLDL